MNNRILNMGLSYNGTFATSFDLEAVDMDTAARAAEAFAQAYAFAGKRGAVYGAGTSGALALRLLERCGQKAQLTGFLDLAPAKKQFQGLPVRHPAQADWGDFLLIAVCPSNYLSVMKTLKELAPERCDLLFLWACEFFDPEPWARLQQADLHRAARQGGTKDEGGAPGGDSRGRVFFEGGRTLRTILEQDFDFYRQLVRDKPRLRALTDLGLVDTWVHTDEPGRLILEHRSLLPQSRANWSLSQYLDAARFFVDFWDGVARLGYSLQDCHTDNVLYDRTRPCFVDFCSIGPAEAATLSGPLLESFFRAWIHPLALVASRQHALLRETIHRQLAWDEVEPLLSPEVAEAVAGLRQASAGRCRALDLPGFLAGAMQWLAGVEVAYSQVGWNSERYQSDALEDARPESAKERLVLELIRKHKPASLLDLGCNKGRFSLLAALEGVDCVSLDTAESLVDKLYLHARSRSLPIQAGIADVAALGGFVNPDRTFDMVAYLALVHHLVFSFGRTMAQVLDQADSLCSRALLLEYVRPHEGEPFVLANYSPALHPDYNPEAIAALLAQRFDTVETFEVDDTRVLYVGLRQPR